MSMYKMISVIITIFYLSCRRDIIEDERFRYIRYASNIASHIYLYYEEKGSYPIAEGSDMETLSKIYCEGDIPCPNDAGINNYIDWYYNGSKNDFIFIAIIKCYSRKCQKYSVFKINPIGIYWRESYANAEIRAKNINANEITYLVRRYLKPSERKDPYLILSKPSLPP